MVDEAVRKEDEGKKVFLDRKNGWVVVKDPEIARRLRSLGANVGLSEEERLSVLEAAYFSEKGVINLDRDELLSYLKEKGEELVSEWYEVMKYLRERGYITRPSMDGSVYLRVHRKGFRPGEDRTYALLRVVNADSKFSFKEILNELETAGRLRKEFVVCFFDGKGEPRFVKISRTNFE